MAAEYFRNNHVSLINGEEMEGSEEDEGSSGREGRGEGGEGVGARWKKKLVGIEIDDFVRQVGDGWIGSRNKKKNSDWK